MIIFENVTKTFANGDTVLENLSFKVEPEEFVIIEGPSGSGKTSLLRLIYKDLEPTSGTIKVDGEDITSLDPKKIRTLRHKVGFAFQDFRIIEDKTIQENISLSLEILGLEDKAIENRVDHLLELVGLSSKKLLFPVQLSGGELQRASLARAMATEPEILLADEPTGNLDIGTAKQIADLLKQINQLGTTVILATHDQPIIDYLDKRQINLPSINDVKEEGDKPEPKKLAKRDKKQEAQDISEKIEDEKEKKTDDKKEKKQTKKEEKPEDKKQDDKPEEKEKDKDKKNNKKQDKKS